MALVLSAWHRQLRVTSCISPTQWALTVVEDVFETVMAQLVSSCFFSVCTPHESFEITRENHKLVHKSGETVGTDVFETLSTSDVLCRYSWNFKAQKTDAVVARLPGSKVLPKTP